MIKYIYAIFAQKDTVMLNTRNKEVQAIFKFDEVFYAKLKKHAKAHKISMKSLVEKHLWPVIKDEITFEDELRQLDKSVEPDSELSSIGIVIENKEERMRTDSRFAELSEL